VHDPDDLWCYCWPAFPGAGAIAGTLMAASSCDKGQSKATGIVWRCHWRSFCLSWCWGHGFSHCWLFMVLSPFFCFILLGILLIILRCHIDAYFSVIRTALKIGLVLKDSFYVF